MTDIKAFLRNLWQQGVELWLENEELVIDLPRDPTALPGMPEQRPHIVELRQQIDARHDAIAAALHDEPEIASGFPVSHGQRAMILMQEISPSSSACNQIAAIQLGQNLDIACLQQCNDLLIQRHEALRTEFFHRDEQLLQRVRRGYRRPVEIISVNGYDDEAVENWISSKSDEPFALFECGPAFGLHLLDNHNPVGAHNRYTLLIKGHHAIIDFIAGTNFVTELTGLYASLSEGTEPQLAELKLRYKDFVIAERELLAGERGQQLWDYWDQQTHQIPSPLALPTDRPRPPKPSFTGEDYKFTIDPLLAASIKKIASQFSATPFVVMTAAYQVLLQRYSGEELIAVGIPMACRGPYRAQRLAGQFTNALPLICDLSPNPSFSSLLTRTLEQIKGATAHQELPFQTIVDRKKLERDLSRPPLFQTALSWNDMNLKRLGVGTGGIAEVMRRQEQRGAIYDLVMGCYDTGSSYGCTLRYNSDIFDHDSVEHMVQSFIQLLRGVIAEPDKPISELSILPPAERRQLAGFNDTATEYPANRSLAELFEARVAANPDAVAIESSRGCMTYAELDQRANQIANQLSGMGVGAGNYVGVSLERSEALLCSVVGILKSGAAYMPMDPDYPDERLIYMLEDTEAPVIISDAAHAERLASLDVPRQPVVLRVDTDKSAIDAQPIERQNTLQDDYADTAACVLFTSGSTGRPKGVLNTHTGLARLAINNRFFDCRADDVMANVSNISFDAASWEIWSALLNGARLYIVDKEVLLNPPEFEKHLRRGHISAILLTTALFNLYANRDPGMFRNIRVVVLGGEAADPNIVRRVLEAGGPQHLINAYGPTENATIASTYEIRELSGDANSVPIGKPIGNSAVYILDKYRHPVPIGVTGEIFCGGDGVALGYLKRDDLNREKFVSDPFLGMIGKQNARMYGTGDLGRFRPDGNIEIVGRMDDQIKIRGFRIELGEIENAVSKHPDVSDCAVMALESDADGSQAGQKYIVAYVVAKALLEGDTERAEFSDRLRHDLRQLLPDYMVPAVFMVLDALPITANGKVDRKALPKPERQASTEYQPPRNEQEKLITALWAGVLDMPAGELGIYDNVFELGAHSLLATQVAARLQDQLGVSLSLRAILEAPTVAELSLALESSPRATALPALEPQQRPESLPLSLAQQRLWFVEQLHPGNVAYVIPAAVRLHGAVNTDTLRQAFNILVDRHESLRTRFLTRNHVGQQQVLPRHDDTHLDIIDLSGQPRDEQHELVIRHATEFAAKPFNIEEDVLLRCALLKLAEDEHVLLISMHHIISDGWSAEVLISELGQIWQACDRNEPCPLPPLPVQYADFTLWQRQWLQGEALEQQLDYWRSQLAGASGLIPLPLDRPRPMRQSFKGAKCSLSLNKQTSDALRQLAQQQQTTLFVVLMAAYSALIHRYAQQDDITIGFPISGRNAAGLEGLIGLFVNNLVIRSDFSDKPSVAALIQQVKQTTMDAYDHQDVPFDLIIDALKIAPGLGHTPFLQVSFALQNNSFDEQLSQEFGRTAELLDFDFVTAKYDLNLTCFDNPEGIRAELDYSTDLFNSSSIERMLSHFQRLLENMLADPEQLVATLPMLSPEEEKQQLSEWNTAANSLHRTFLLHNEFERRAQQSPQAIALRCESDELSYAELNARANRIAHALLAKGVKAGDFVGLCLERSNELIAALLGILKSGAAYVPLDPHFPAERLGFILQDSEATIVVSSSQLADSLGAYQGQRLFLDTDTTVATQSSDNPDISIAPDSIAYVLYTSGTTGKPKGCLVSHANVARLFSSTESVFGFDQQDNWTLFHSYAFDFSVWEIWGALLYGGKLVVVPYWISRDPEAFYKLLAEQQISVLNQTPSAFSQLISIDAAQEEPQPLALRYVIFGGEALDFKALRTWTHHHSLDKPRLVNMFGITETTVHVTHHRVTQQDIDMGASVIGRPIDDLQVHILDQHGQLLPIGVAGEIHVSGPGVTRGYLKRPDLSAEKFIPNHLLPRLPEQQQDSHRTLYRSGDLGRYRSNGDIEYLGRIDFQVKIRGHRLELGEIENALGQLDNIREALVIVHGDGEDKRLVAYLLAKNHQQPASVDDIRSELKQHLPDYMIPAAFVFLDKWPLTATGKVDRKNLPEPELSSSTEYVAPRNESEQVIATFFAEVLGNDKVGVNDNFFEIGGHSLLATQVISRIRDHFNSDIELRTIFEKPTVAELAVSLLESALDDIDMDDLEAMLQMMDDTGS